MRKPTSRERRLDRVARLMPRAMRPLSIGDIMEEMRREIASRMVEIAEMFVPGATVTVLVRYPADDRAEMCITDDEIPDLIAMLQRCQAREAEKAG